MCYPRRVLCGRCHNVVPDGAAVCVACGAPVSGRIDSYAATAFAPVMTPAGPARVAGRDVATAPTSDAIGAVRGDIAGAPTMMSAQAPPDVTMPVQRPPATSPHPPTMRSSQTPPAAQPGPQYMVAPTPPPQLSPYYPASQSSGQMPPSPYAPPPIPGSYGFAQAPMLAPMAPRTSASGLAIASLICGLLGLVPFWIGFLLCLLAITFGAIVLTQSRPGDAGRGMAIAGLVLGLVFVLPAACGL